MKICVYAITKNEEKNVDSWYESMKEADEIVVLDTGSTDETVNKLKKYPKIKVIEKIISPWRFDVARNLSLSYVSEDVDICVCTDLDERFENGWRKHLEQNWQEGATRGKYLYHWSFKDGKPATTFYLNKIHTRFGYTWTHPVHEVLTPLIEEKEILIPSITLNHYQNIKESRTSYLPLLELSVKEDPEDDRNMHYLGREYMYYKKYDKAIETLHKHLSLKKATWKEERCASMRYIAYCYAQKGYVEEAEFWYKKAIVEAPYVREPYYDIANFYYENKKDKEAIRYSAQALKIKEKSLSYINEENAWNERIYDLLSICYYNIGEYQKAYKNCKIAHNINPKEERIYKNYLFIKEINRQEKLKRKVTKSI